MATKIYASGNYLVLDDAVDVKYIPVSVVRFSVIGSNYTIKDRDGESSLSIDFADIRDASGVAYADEATFLTFLENSTGFNSATNGGGGGGSVDTFNGRSPVDGNIVPKVADYSNFFVQFDDSLPVYVEVKNASGATIPKGKAVYITNVVSASGKPEIALADSSSASTMNAVGVTHVEIADGAESLITISGIIPNLDTSAYDAGDTLYINGSGDFSTTKPTGTGLIQNIGVVTRSHATSGAIGVIGSGRSNDLPNLLQDHLWLGDSNGVPQAVNKNTLSAVDERMTWALTTDVFALPVIAYQPITAEVNSSGSVNPIVVSGTEPFTSYAVTSGALPTGFSLDSETGVVSWSVGGSPVSVVNVGITATSPVGVGTEYVVAMSVEAPNGREQYTNDENLYAGVRISTSNSTRSQVFLKQTFHGTTTSTSNGTIIENSAYPIWVADNGNGTWNYFMQPGGYTYWNFFLNSTTNPSDLANGFVSDITTSLTYDLVAPNSQDVIHDGVRYPSDSSDIHYFTSRYFLRIGNDSSLDGFCADAGGSWSFGFKLIRDWKPDGLGRPMFAREGRNWQGIRMGHSATYSEMIFGNGSSQTYDSTETSTLPSGGFTSGSYVRCTYDDSSNVFSFYVDGVKYYDYAISSYLDDSPTADALDIVFGKSVDSDDLANTSDSRELSYWQGAFERLWIANGAVVSTDDDGVTYPTGTTHAWDMAETTGKTFTSALGGVTMEGDRTTF